MSKFNPLWWSKPPVILSYGVAILSVTAVLMIARWIELAKQSVPHVSLLLCAVMFSAWFGGFKASLLAIALSVLAFDYYFLSPTPALGVESTELPRLLFFSVSALFVGLLSATQKSASDSLRDARDNLNRTVQELKRTNEALEAENTERRRAEEAFRTAQMELAHVTRVATLGEMTASIAHEINQPLGALVNNAGACLGWLDAENLEEARNSVALVMDDAQRASEIITGIRALVKKAPPKKDWLDINQIIREVIALAQSEVQRNHIALQTQLSDDMPLVFTDRIQLKQVMLNLMMNAIEAMTQVSGPRELLISSGADDSKGVVVVVQDSGPGLDSKSLERLFEPFYTTKPQGMGMGLAICRSIIEAHDGRLWAATNRDRGASFHFSLPTGEELE